MKKVALEFFLCEIIGVGIYFIESSQSLIDFDRTEGKKSSRRHNKIVPSLLQLIPKGLDISSPLNNIYSTQIPLNDKIDCKDTQ